MFFKHENRQYNFQFTSNFGQFELRKLEIGKLEILDKNADF